MLRAGTLAFLFLALVGCKKKSPAEITVGDTVWMGANLSTTVYSNGDSIPRIEDAEEWARADYGAYCNYANSEDSVKSYGRLYNWYAVNDARGLCPTGWRVATAADWENLSLHFGGDSVSAKHLKGKHLWLPSNYPGDNASGLNFLPGGNRKESGVYNGRRSSAPLWTATEKDLMHALARFMNKNHYHVGIKEGDKKNGLGCRCVKTITR